MTSRPLESCHHQCLKAVCGVLGYSKGSALELLDGTLKLRHCTTLFTMHFSPWSSPKVGNGGGKRQSITPGGPLDAGSNVGKRVRLTRKTRPGASSHVHSGSQASNAEEMEKIAPPVLRGVGGEVGEPRNLFPRLGLGEGLLWGRLEPAAEETGVWFFPAGQSSRRGWCAGTSSFFEFIARMR